MSGKQKFYLFRCNKQSYRETIEKMIFGASEESEGFISNVKINDILFLHNVTEIKYKEYQFIEGPYYAISDSTYKLDPTAFKGQFPWQVRVERKGHIIRFYQHSFEKLGLKYSYQNLFFPFTLNESMGMSLLKLNEDALLNSYEF